MNNENIIYRHIDGKGEHRRLSRRFVFLGIFIFVMVATFSFFLTRGMEKTHAVDFSGFKPGNIISDDAMRNYTSMTESEIQSFLDRKASCDRSASGGWYVDSDTIYGVKYNYKATYGDTTYFYHVEDGKYVCMNSESFNGESAAHIIYSLSQKYKINPQVLIVLLEKEQGLITDSWPNSNYQYRSATGFGCPDTAPCDSEYYGLRNQVESAAWLFDQVLSGGWTNYDIGDNWIRYSPDSSCGGSWVSIENKATAALYRYTPYQPNEGALKNYPGGSYCGAYGNRNFYAFYTEWFGSTQIVAQKAPLARLITSDTFEFKVGNDEYLIPTSNAQGARLVVSDSASKENRQFKLTESNGYYTITHVKSGLVVDLSGASLEDGVLQLYASNNTNAQKWRLTVESDTNYILRSSISDNKVLTLTGGSADEKSISLDYYGVDIKKQQITVVDTAEPVIKDDVYSVETTGGKSFDVDGGRYSNGTRILTYNIAHNKKQQYEFKRTTDGFYTIKNIASGRVIDVAGAGTYNGAEVQLYDSNNTCAQKWIVEKNGAGYRFLSQCSGKAIDVPGGNTDRNEQRLQIYTANGTNAQVFILNVLNPLADGEYIIESAVGKNKVIDIAGGAEYSRNGTNINIYDSNGTNAQKFKVTYDASSRLYSIINEYAKRSIDVSGADTSSGANIQVWESNGTCAQLWHLRVAGNNQYNIISSCSDKVIDVAGAGSYNGANIQTYSLNNTNAQKWTFKKVEKKE